MSALEAGPLTTGVGVADRFRAVAADAPDRVALSTAQRSWTYSEIDRWSDAIARALIAASPPLDVPVAIFATTNVPLVPAAVGAVKAGHFYFTVDATEPEERIELLLREARTGACVVESSDSVPRAFRHLPIIPIGTTPAADTALDPPPRREPNPLVNLVFTSGTTGKPKGIVTKQEGFVANLLRSRMYKGIGPGDRVVYRSLPGFTRANQIVGGLLAGATLCAMDARNTDLGELSEFIRRERITRLTLTPAVFRRLLQTPPEGLDLSAIRKVRCGADIVTLADVALFKKHFPEGCVLDLGYASSETGGGVFQMSIRHDTPVPGPLVPIGRPRKDVEVRIVDDDGNDVPAGTAGELLVTAREVIEGYWNAPEESESRIIHHPDRPDVRTFRTGDLVMRDDEGLYYFVGRKDFRIRVHNRRIDPLQIENALVTLGPIREAVVVGKPDAWGEMHLVAYVVMKKGEPCVPRAIRAELRRTLPSWMIPVRIHAIDEIPISSGAGKVDRRALIARVDPEPGGGSDASDDLERKLAAIWSRSVGMSVSVRDDFFDDLGGESVVAAQLVTEVQRATGVSIPMSMLLELPTVARMAEFLRGSSHAGSLAVLVQAGGPREPLFCVTGRDGSVIKFRHLAARLGDGRPFYGLTFHGFELDDFPTSSATLVACYAEAIRRIQPQGPYYLAGYSGGARNAAQIATLLERQGETVAFVGFLDAAGATQHATLLQRMGNRVDMARRRPAKNGLGYLAELSSRPLRMLKRWLADWRGARGVIFPKPVRAKNQAHARLRGDGPSHPLGATATLFRAHNGLGRLSTSPDAGWSSVGVGHLEIVDVPGDHNTILTDDVDALARELAAAVERAERRLVTPA